jgi:hypothetical protein
MAALSPRKGELKVGNTKRGKGAKWMVVVDGTGTSTGSIPGHGDPGRGPLLENILDVEILHASKVLTEKVIASLHAKQAGVL